MDVSNPYGTVQWSIANLTICIPAVFCRKNCTCKLGKVAEYDYSMSVAIEFVGQRTKYVNGSQPW